jgi:hypothetical protein
LAELQRHQPIIRTATVVIHATLLILAVMILILQPAAAQTCYPAYQLTTSSLDYYSLAGVTMQIPNGTTVSVTGMFAPYNTSSMTHPIPHYKGLIYVQFLATNTATYTCTNMTIVQVSGNMTETGTISNSYPPGLQTVTVIGSIFSQPVCVRPVQEFQGNVRGILAIGIASVLILTAILLTNQRRLKLR